MTVWRLIRPLDVLYLRGNRLFGGAGDHSEPLMPPWPSLFAGAIRSRMLVDAGVDLGRFTGEAASLPPGGLVGVLGTPAEPGSFRIAAVTLLAPGDSAHQPEPVVPLPADLVVTRADGNGSLQAGRDEGLEVTRLEPVSSPPGIATSAATPLLLGLRRAAPAKPEPGYWLTLEGLKRWLAGETPEPQQLVHRSALWDRDPRLGIAMDRGTGTSARGKLYTSETVAMVPGAGFLVGIDGAADAEIPRDGLLRLGGDGRGAEIAAWEGTLPPGDTVRPGEPFTLYLETPGLFPSGWLPPGVNPETLELRAQGLAARLVAAAVPRHAVVSGWNVAAHAPKPAQRAVPAGAVYYFDQVEGEPELYSRQLWKVIELEMSEAFDAAWKQRRAEGFNSVGIGRWPGGVS